MRPDTLLAIAGMAIIMYATRAGGFWLVGRLPASPRTAPVLDQLASVTVVALTAPAILNAGVPGLAAAAAAGFLGARTGSVLLAMLAGMLVVWAARFVAGNPAG